MHQLKLKSAVALNSSSGQKLSPFAIRKVINLGWMLAKSALKPIQCLATLKSYIKSYFDNNKANKLKLHMKKIQLKSRNFAN